MSVETCCGSSYLHDDIGMSAKCGRGLNRSRFYTASELSPCVLSVVQFTRSSPPSTSKAPGLQYVHVDDKTCMSKRRVGCMLGRRHWRHQSLSMLAESRCAGAWMEREANGQPREMMGRLFLELKIDGGAGRCDLSRLSQCLRLSSLCRNREIR